MMAERWKIYLTIVSSATRATTDYHWKRCKQIDRLFGLLIAGQVKRHDYSRRFLYVAQNLKGSQPMTKSTITRERAQQIFPGNGPEPSASEERELARMTLVAMDSEPHHRRRII
ncbi:hypothetical protein P5P93_24570 [Klebsiella pneumoniae]|nr:hypothetical protein P5P93_24570 [Klebsiella pneumoniae]